MLLLAACATVAEPASPTASLAPPLSDRSTGPAAHPAPLALLKDADPVLAANKRLVFDMWRGVVNGGHVELADRMLAEDYIQHSPVIPTGRAAFKQVFSAVERRAEIPPLVSPPLVTIIAEGHLVAMVLREELPATDGGTYASAHFNLFRVADGRLAEHWHSVQAAPGAHVPPPAGGGPRPVRGLTGAAQVRLLEAADPQLAANKRLVFDTWRTAIDQGWASAAARYLAGDYVEHNANDGPGFRAFMPRPGAGAIDAPLVAMLAQEDLVVMVLALEHPHPVRPGERYTTTWFDMFRVNNGRIAEHWDGALRAGAPEPAYGN